MSRTIARRACCPVLETLESKQLLSAGLRTRSINPSDVGSFYPVHRTAMVQLVTLTAGPGQGGWVTVGLADTSSNSGRSPLLGRRIDLYNESAGMTFLGS